MSNADSDEQFDADVLQRKGDILRARDIIPGTPPYKNITRREPDSQQTDKNEPRPPAVLKTSVEKEHGGENVPETRSEQVKADEDIPAVAAKTEQQKSEIPKFDLAEDIMAEQRRITAIRRKAPGKRDEAQRQEQEAESIGYTVGQPTPALSEQEHIIAEIVARDIERLCKGGTSGVRNW